MPSTRIAFRPSHSRSRPSVEPTSSAGQLPHALEPVADRVPVGEQPLGGAGDVAVRVQEGLERAHQLGLVLLVVGRRAARPSRRRSPAARSGPRSSPAAAAGRRRSPRRSARPARAPRRRSPRAAPRRPRGAGRPGRSAWRLRATVSAKPGRPASSSRRTAAATRRAGAASAPGTRITSSRSPAARVLVRPLARGATSRPRQRSERAALDRARAALGDA